MLFDPSDFAFVNGGVGSAGLSLVANTKSANGLFDPRFAPTQLATASSRLESAIRYLLTEKYASAPAAWYDTQDFSTMFQDVAMTIPAALEQPVAIQLDKSGRGWHRSQATAAKRAKLSRRYNLLNNTVNLAGAGWAGFGSATGPQQVSLPTAGAYWYSTISIAPVVVGATITWSAVVDSANRIVTFGGATPAGTDTFASTALGDGRYRQVLTRTFSDAAAGSVQTMFGLATGVFNVSEVSCVWTPDANLPYQRVTSAADYDADPAKFPAYLSIDGVDDAYVTATQAGWDTTSAVTAFAAVQRFANAATGIVYELGNDVGTLVGHGMLAPLGSGLNSVGALSNGGTYKFASVGVPATYKGILTGRANILTPSVQARYNGVAGTAVTTTQGAGPYANNPINWFARNQSSYYFKGNAFGEILIGAQMLDDEVKLVEKYLAMKAGVAL